MSNRIVSVIAVWIVGAALLGPAARADEGGSTAGELPPVECVQMLRSARGLLEQGDERGGVKLLRETVARYPDEIVAVAALWEYHRDHGLPEEEAARLRGALIERLRDPAAALPPGVLHYLVENPRADEEELRLLLEAAQARRKDDDVEMLRAIANLQLRLGLLEEARETYVRLADRSSLEMLDWDIVLLNMKLERWADAAAGLKPLVAKKDGSLAARTMYVDALSRLGDYDEMARQIDRIAVDNPLVAEVVNTVLRDAAWNLRDAGMDEEAEAVFRRILATNPEDAQARAALLYLYGTEAELQTHLATLAAQEKEADPYALLEQGGNLLAAGDAEQALRLLERASEGLPEDEIVWFNLGLAALKLERWATAEQAFLRATKLNPERADSYLNRASALYRLDRCAEAIPLLDRTLDLAPTQSNAYYYLYACHAELGNDEAASEAKRRYEAR